MEEELRLLSWDLSREYIFWIEKTKIMIKKRRSMEENRALWGHGDKKINLTHWRILERENVLSDIIIEPEHEREVTHESLLEEEEEDIFLFLTLKNLVISKVSSFLWFPSHPALSLSLSNLKNSDSKR